MRLQPQKILILSTLLILFALLTVMTSAQQVDLDQSTEGLTSPAPDLVVEFAMRYPSAWAEIVQNGIPGGGRALALLQGGEPRVIFVASVVLARTAADAVVSENGYTYPVEGQTGDISEFQLEGQDGALRRGVLPDTRRTWVGAVRLEPGIYAFAQAVGDNAGLSSVEDALLAMLGSIRVIGRTDTRQLLAEQGDSQRICELLATVRIDTVNVVNAEEARGQFDFGQPGDEITLTYALGPLKGENDVDYGDREDYLVRWPANLEANQSALVAGEISRYVCDPDFGLYLSLIEDDSTVFGRISTPLDEPALIVLIRDNQQIVQPGAQSVFFRGDTQDGNFEYRIDYIVSYDQQPVRIDALTPTLTPSMTFTPSPTFTPSETLTPSPTFTFTPSSTPTPSDTPSPSNTPSPTFTASPTFTPSNTPTANLRATSQALEAESTAFIITMQAAQIQAT